MASAVHNNFRLHPVYFLLRYALPPLSPRGGPQGMTGKGNIRKPSFPGKIDSPVRF